MGDQFKIGIAGLDATGRNLARALGEKHISVVVFDPNAENIRALRAGAAAGAIRIVQTLDEFMALLRHFRTIVISGRAEDGDLFADLLKRLEAEDLVIDAGHCHFKDCGRRAHRLSERSIRYLGMGVIGGGGEGVTGHVLLAAGRPEIYESVLPILEAMAAKKDGKIWLSHLGNASAAGHFVRTIHDATEHGLRQIVRETSDLLKLALGTSHQKVSHAAKTWQLSLTQDNRHNEAAFWSAQIAHELQVNIPTMLAALGMRTLSEFDRKNHFSTTPFRQPVGPSATDAESIFDELQGALDTAVIITYAQGLSLLAAGSDRYGFEIDLAEIVGLWRGCCGIRPALLDEIISVLKVSPNLPNLLCDADLSEKVMERQESLRHAVRRAETLQKPVPALLASLDYLDFHRDAWLPGNLIQVPGVRHVLQMPSRAVGLHAEWNHR